jgi:gliding motility-associated-like protein
MKEGIKHVIIIFFFFFLIFDECAAQCTFILSSITTKSNFQQINDVGVSVSSPTNAQANRVMNYEGISGYYLGGNNTSEEILFTLSKPIKQLVITARALSAFPNNDEFFVLQMNGQNYIIKPAQLTTPDPLAGISCFLQSNGSILGDTSLANFGDGSFIFKYNIDLLEQDITSFKIKDSVAIGLPEGAFFDVQISSSLSTSIDQQPSNLSVCDSSNAIFTIGVTNSSVLKWQVNGDSLWKDLTDDNIYSGTTANMLNIKDVDVTMNNYTYRCIVETPCDSIFSTSARLMVHKCRTPFYIPSAFTPNNDGKNDFFKPIIIDSINGYEFNVFNRWGQKIFETYNVNTGWDGIYEGANQSAGAYIWGVKIIQLDNTEKTYKGSVILVR